MGSPLSLFQEGQPFDMAEFMEAARSGQHLQYPEKSAGLGVQCQTPRSRDHIYQPTVAAMTPLFPQYNSTQGQAAESAVMPLSAAPDLRGAPTLSWVGKVRLATSLGMGGTHHTLGCWHPGHMPSVSCTRVPQT